MDLHFQPRSSTIHKRLLAHRYFCYSLKGDEIFFKKCHCVENVQINAIHILSLDSTPVFNIIISYLPKTITGNLIYLISVRKSCVCYLPYSRRKTPRQGLPMTMGLFFEKPGKQSCLKKPEEKADLGIYCLVRDKSAGVEKSKG